MFQLKNAIVAYAISHCHVTEKVGKSNLLRLIPCVKPCSQCHQTDSILALRVQPLLNMKYTWNNIVRLIPFCTHTVSHVTHTINKRFCPISPNPISPNPILPKPISPNPDPNPIPNPIPNAKHTVTLKLTVNIRRNGIRRNGRTRQTRQSAPTFNDLISIVY